MNLKTYLKKLIEHRIRVTPVLSLNEEGLSVVTGWQAAHMSDTETSVQAVDPVTAVHQLSQQLEEHNVH